MTPKNGWNRRHFLRTAGGIGAWALSRAGAARGADDGERPITGIGHPGLASFDALLRDLVDKHHAVGVSLAVTKNGRLVYARGYGLADRERRELVQPESLFRIASITKPLTATATLQLVERKKLAFSDKVHEVLGLPAAKDKRWQQVTIQQLLHHTGGWDRDKSFDPMFRSVQIAKKLKAPPPAMPEQIIRYMLQQPLDFDPGSRYAYSNFGYSLLGRVIERASGVYYGEHVRGSVLKPLGIERTRLGATLPEHRARDEVHYYDLKDRTGPAVMGKVGEQVPLPYGAWCLEAMDSHGGWIASAVDLVRFASSFDVPEKCRILRPASIETMFARPRGPAGQAEDGKPKVPFYACGWSVRPAGSEGRNTWHTGALDGTSTLLVRRFDGLTWAVLFNCRQGSEGKELAGVVDPLVHQAADAVMKWPQVNHFEQYL